MTRFHRALFGAVAAAAVVSLPLVTASAAAPKKKAPAKKAAPAKAKGDVKAGLTAFKAEGCTGCHKTKDFADAGTIGPDLSKIAAEHKAPEIAAYIKKPKSGSIMPAFKGPQKAIDDMTAYLLTQK